MAVANNLAANRASCSCETMFLMSGVISQIIPFCNTHSPNSVIIINEIISYLTFLLVDLKVYFLLAKKLKTKAEPVEIVLAAIFGNPKKVSKNNKPKSIAVLIVPTIAKRPICILFFTLGLFRFVIFGNEIARAILGFAKDTGDIFADNTKTNQLNTAKK